MSSNDSKEEDLNQLDQQQKIELVPITELFQPRIVQHKITKEIRTISVPPHWILDPNSQWKTITK